MVTSTLPGACGGAATSICVVELFCMVVAATPPNDSEHRRGRRFPPVAATSTRPRAEPIAGERPAMRDGTDVYVYTFGTVPVSPPHRTETSTVPASCGGVFVVRKPDAD